MKYFMKKIILGQSLREGFLGVRIFMAACLLCALTGCGKDSGTQSRLLAELGQEAADGAEGSEESAEGTLAGEDEAGIKGFGEGGEGGSGQLNTGDKAGEDAGQGAGGGESTEAAGSILVHVCGAVAEPGVYELPEGSRFYEAVDAAGGFAADACQDYLNMAAYLADGSRLEIPALQDIQEREQARGSALVVPGGDDEKEYSYYTAPEAPAPEAGGGGSSSGGLVNINTADIAGLCGLPGIGEGRARAIVEYREKQGGFQKKEDIMQVSGIGEKMYARMEAYLTVE